jgi:hypothetical protein
MAIFIHEFVTNRRAKASCSCGWESAKASNNKRKSWRQHVTRGTR